MNFSKFTHSLYFRLFLASFGLEVVLEVITLIWPQEVWPPAPLSRTPAFQWFMGAAFGVALLTMVIGGALVIYNPRLNRYPDQPMSLDLGGLASSNDESGVAPDPPEEWPDWRLVVPCILILGGVIMLYLIHYMG